jgi:hypothetical protein
MAKAGWMDGWMMWLDYYASGSGYGFMEFWAFLLLLFVCVDEDYMIPRGD